MSAFARGAKAHHGRDDRATCEQVMDPRTRLILFKLIQGGIIGEMHGCVSTGKEANVYHATLPCAARCKRAKELAVKVYKTSILVFRDRDRYVAGEHRFRQGYCKSNPRKMRPSYPQGNFWQVCPPPHDSVLQAKLNVQLFYILLSIPDMHMKNNFKSFIWDCM